MPGSIRKRADRGKNVYELRVFLGRDDYGRVRHKSTIFRGPLRAAEMELARLVTEKAAEPDPIPLETAFGPTTTISMAIMAWKEKGWQDLSPSTTRRYNSIWTTHTVLRAPKKSKRLSLPRRSSAHACTSSSLPPPPPGCGEGRHARSGGATLTDDATARSALRSPDACRCPQVV